jgi:RimJ/RimL family protein N-acetyltransferase
VISPFPESSVPRIWVWMQQFRERVCDDFAPKTIEEFVADWRARPKRSWAVYQGEELGGMIVFEPTSPAAGILHVIFKRTFWGPAITVPAARHAIAEIFASGFIKISAFPFTDNDSLRSAARRFGFRNEGVQRGQTLRGGKPVDQAVMGLTLEDWNELRKQNDANDQPQPVAAAAGDARPAVGIRVKPDAGSLGDAGAAQNGGA